MTERQPEMGWETRDRQRWDDRETARDGMGDKRGNSHTGRYKMGKPIGSSHAPLG